MLAGMCCSLSKPHTSPERQIARVVLCLVPLRVAGRGRNASTVVKRSVCTVCLETNALAPTVVALARVGRSSYGVRIRWAFADIDS
jgi:hypothetical protein